jgi:hypothetical protein
MVQDFDEAGAGMRTRKPKAIGSSGDKKPSTREAPPWRSDA